MAVVAVVVVVVVVVVAVVVVVVVVVVVAYAASSSSSSRCRMATQLDCPMPLTRCELLWSSREVWGAARACVLCMWPCVCCACISGAGCAAAIDLHVGTGRPNPNPNPNPSPSPSPNPNPNSNPSPNPNLHVARVDGRREELNEEGDERDAARRGHQRVSARQRADGQHARHVRAPCAARIHRPAPVDELAG